MFKCSFYPEYILDLHVCLPIHFILLHFFQLSVSLIYKFCYIYCYVPTHFQFKILHIFCSHLCSIYFGCAVKIFLVRIIQFCYLSHSFSLWFLVPPFFNCLCSLFLLLWYTFHTLLSVSLSPHWSLSRTYIFFIFSFFVKGEYNPVGIFLLVPKFSN